MMACQKEQVRGGGRFQCNLCCSTFSRNAHLQRHLQTHVSQKPFSCQFCLLTFKRGDALRKHWKSCSLREMFGEPIPAQKLPGRRRRACDGCAALRQRCDLGSPCGNCASRQRGCSYSSKQYQSTELSLTKATRTSIPARLPTPEIDLMLGHGMDHDFGGLASLPASGDEGIFSGVLSTSVTPSDNGTTIILEWLVNFTTCFGLDKAFNFMTPSESFCDVTSLTPTSIYEHVATVQAKMAVSSVGSGVIEISEMMSWLSSPYISLSRALWNMADTYRQGFACFITPSEDEFLRSSEFVQLFAPRNVEFFLDLYWNRWAHNCPIIHEASFDPNQTCPELIFVMAIIGALLCQEEMVLLSARKCLDIAEKIIFQHSFFRSEAGTVTGVEDKVSLHANLDMLRSGLLVSVLQNWEGSQEARSRIRHDRYHSVVLAARSMKFSAAKHSTEIDIETAFIDWSKFVLIEELIRTQTFIFLLDTAFTIFYNCPPRIVVSELDISCSCTDYCFEAQDGVDFLARIRESHPDYGRTMKFIIRDIMQDIVNSKNTHSEKLCNYSNLTTLDLFTVISGIHSMIFCHQMSLSLFPSSVAIFQQSLENWIHIWTFRVPLCNTSALVQICNLRQKSQRGPGFARHASEYHTLAEAKLKILCRDNTTIMQALALNAESEDVADVVHLALGLKYIM